MTGGVVDCVFAVGHDEYSLYVGNGANNRLANGFATFDFTTGTTPFLGQATDAWVAVFLQGAMRGRFTKENRTNHAPTYIPATWPVPTT